MRLCAFSNFFSWYTHALSSCQLFSYNTSETAVHVHRPYTSIETFAKNVYYIRYRTFIYACNILGLWNSYKRYTDSTVWVVDNIYKKNIANAIVVVVDNTIFEITHDYKCKLHVGGQACYRIVRAQEVRFFFFSTITFVQRCRVLAARARTLYISYLTTASIGLYNIYFFFNDDWSTAMYTVGQATQAGRPDRRVYRRISFLYYCSFCFFYK